MKKLMVMMTFILLSFRAYPIVGEETALMIELVSTTASQLNELETLVTNTERYTERLRQYNELVQDEYFKAERVLYLAEELASKKRVEDLGGLNSAIRDLKYNMSDLKELQKEYGLVEQKHQRTEAEIAEYRMLNQKKKARAETQVAHAITSDSSGRSTQLTAQNTALIHETQTDMRDTQLDILETLSENNKLVAGDLAKKRFDELKRLKDYGLDEEGSLK